MVPKSSGKTGSKRKRGSVPSNKKHRLAASKAASTVSWPLRAQSDPIRKQELRKERVQNDVRRNQDMYQLPNLEVAGLISRTLSASLNLPIRMTRCRSPLDVWSEQCQFLRSITDDYQSVAFRMMTVGLVALPEAPPAAQRKKR